METRDARSLSGEAQQELRMRAVRAVLDGKTHVAVAETFGVTRHAVDKWVKKYREGGWDALKAKRQGRPKGGSLKPWQCAQIARVVVDKHPEQLKFPWFLWTREAVGALIERKYGVRLSVWTVGRHLRRWGFTPQKPLKQAYEQNPEAVQRWLDEEYPQIQKDAKAAGASIFWADEMGLRSDHTAGRTWGLKGQTPVVPATGQRFGCNMISALSNQGKLYFMVMRGGFDGKVFIEFLDRMVRQIGRTVFLIVDRHPVHRSKVVWKWLHEHHEQLRMFYLPSYSPDLNPDEQLNQDVKANAVGRKRPRDRDELVGNVRSHLKSRQRTPRIIQNFFQAPSVRYAAA
jgi:transposase